MPVVAELGGPTSLAGWQLRIVDGNHLSEVAPISRTLSN
jgi:hypothetical protein